MKRFNSEKHEVINFVKASRFQLLDPSASKKKKKLQLDSDTSSQYPPVSLIFIPYYQFVKVLYYS